MILLVSLLIGFPANAANGVAYENFINDLVDSFRKPFQEKLAQISTNTIPEPNPNDTFARFFATEPNICMLGNTVGASVTEIKVTQTLRPEQSHAKIEYRGCDVSQVIFEEYLMVQGNGAKTYNLNNLFRENIDLTLGPNETEKYFLVMFRGIRLFQVISKRINSADYLTRFELMSKEIIVIHTHTEPDIARLKLAIHPFEHKYISGFGGYSFTSDNGDVSIYIEVKKGSTFNKYFDSARAPISKISFDNTYNKFFIGSLQNTIGGYFNFFMSSFPRTKKAVDTRGSTEFLNKLKDVYLFLISNQIQNAQRMVESLISDIESGKTQVHEQSQ